MIEKGQLKASRAVANEKAIAQAVEEASLPPAPGGTLRESGSPRPPIDIQQLIQQQVGTPISTTAKRATDHLEEAASLSKSAKADDEMIKTKSMDARLARQEASSIRLAEGSQALDLEAKEAALAALKRAQTAAVDAPPPRPDEPQYDDEEGDMMMRRGI